jgi:hypothetical protein|tara:strand:+ start:921 stop:1157 length:237 start_codon:yes stop_codon:yes gene_type:complete
MFEVLIGFETKEKRYEVGDILKKEDLKAKDFSELKKMGVIEKADLNKTMKRARNDKGHFIADDPNTPENEAWYETEEE